MSEILWGDSRGGTASYGTSSYSTAPYGTSSYSTAPYGTASYGTVPYGTASYSTVPYGTASYSTAPYGSGSYKWRNDPSTSCYKSKNRPQSYSLTGYPQRGVQSSMGGGSNYGYGHENQQELQRKIGKS